MIKQSILKKVAASPLCRAELEITLKKSWASVDRYLKLNHIMLTTAPALAVIEKYTGATKEEILEVEEQPATA